MNVYLMIALLAVLSSCGLLGGDENGGLFTITRVSAVEVALQIRSLPGNEITVERNGKEIYSFHLNQHDTVLYDAGLQPATSYNWRITSQSSVNSRMQISEQQATTLDTTSSNFTWQTFSFGEHSSSVLYGVSIIDEDNIWAVGEIHMNDSTGQSDNQIYNAVHWDGNEWNLKRITVDFRGNLITPPLNAIHAFSASDIWLSSGVPVHGDGTNWTQYHLFDMGILDDSNGGTVSVWGRDSTNVYFGGALGSLAHWNGQTWQKIETETNLDFYDIHGNVEQGVVAIAAKRFVNARKEIIAINSSQQAKPLPTAGIPYSIHGIWFNNAGVTYLVGAGIFRRPEAASTVSWQGIHEGVSNYYLQAIDANGLNDIVICGDLGELLHFDGAEWISYQPEFDGKLLLDISIRGDVVVASGLGGSKAFITIGKRVNQ